MSKELFSMPEPRPALRNGDALVEFIQNGEVVGEFNFSKVLRNWWNTLDAAKKASLKVVP